MTTAEATITAHDYQPTHSYRPSWLITAQDEMVTAWRAAGECSRDEYPAAECAAVAAQEWYSQLYEMWMAGAQPVIVTSDLLEFAF